MIRRPRSHRNCMVCGESSGLGLEFSRIGGGVCCTLAADPAWQGYSGTLHGGMICTLLDAAMTHCLFSQGLEGVTADLQVRFLNPVPVPGDCLLSLQAELLRHRLGTFWVTARLACADPSSRIFATAKARFRPHRHPARS